MDVCVVSCVISQIYNHKCHRDINQICYFSRWLVKLLISPCLDTIVNAFNAHINQASNHQLTFYETILDLKIFLFIASDIINDDEFCHS